MLSFYDENVMIFQGFPYRPNVAMWYLASSSMELQMTRKDYKLIAHAIAVAKHEFTTVQEGYATPTSVLHFLTGYLSVGLQSDNPRFNRDKFVVAALGAK